MARMPKSAQDRARLAQQMDLRRLELGLTWTRVARDGGITPETLRQARSGAGGIAELTLAAIDRGLRWQQGSARTALAGGDPTPLADDVRHLSVVPPAQPGTVAAINADVTLDQDTREHLIRQYWLLREVAAARGGGTHPPPLDPHSGHLEGARPVTASVTPSAPASPDSD